ncbi:S24 family peptidase [Sinorhizobium meliloti]|uniref:S24 family peptidase n=1 Tax=Rhizobium meliloti TaxID=382 RepID=UPI001F1CB848|nr:S24 family peptidase [Sinorhizobium meliloti]
MLHRMGTLKEIVENRLAELGLGAVEAAVQGGIERTFIRDIVEGKKKSVRSDKVEGLARALRLDPAALARNEMVPMNGEHDTRQRLVGSFDPDAEEHSQDTGAGYTREHWRANIKGAIPEIDVKLGAGEGSIGEVINLPVSASNVSGHHVVAEWFIPDAYLRNEVRASPSHTLIMEVVGDSMFPTYSPGDRVIVDLSQDRLVSDTVYAISDGYSEPQIKRLQRVPFSEPTEVRIISDNPNLETFTVELSRVQIIGRICGHIARR